MATWEELESAARRMRETFEKTKHRMYYSERAQMERDVNLLEDEARRQCDRYTQWLYTGR